MWLILFALLVRLPLVCCQCTEGYYEAVGPVCLVCPAGKYADTAGLTECTDCPPGRFIEDNGVNWKLHAHSQYCWECPPGRASAAGGATACTDCPAGKFAYYAASFQCDDCFSGVALSAGAVTCEACSPGSIPSVDFTACEPCAVGKYAGSWSSTCYDCWSGAVSTIGSSTCDNCPAGKYQQNTQCIDCAAGSSSTEGSTECWQCFEGTASASGGSECLVCPAGKFAGMQAAECSNCAAGKYNEYSYSFECWDCFFGFSTAGSTACDPCPPGTESSTDFASCVNCAAGKYRNNDPQQFGGMMWNCMDCDWGFASSEGSATCQICPPGTYSVSDKTECKQCDPGTFQPDPGGYDSCMPCPAVVSSDFVNCTNCPPGTVTVGNETGRSCDPCEVGKASNDPSGFLPCEDCPIGRYASQTGLVNCTPCVGLATLATGATSINQCIAPVSGQAFQCVQGKQCQITGLQGAEALNASRLMVLQPNCRDLKLDSFAQAVGWPLADIGDFFDFYGGSNAFSEYGGGYGGYGDSSSNSGVDAGELNMSYGFTGHSTQGSTDFQWSGQVGLDAGSHTLCWCGGAAGELCKNPQQFSVSVGSLTILGPFANQQIICAIGRQCLNVGPIKGTGLLANDEIRVRAGCTAAEAGLLEVKFEVQHQTSQSGDSELLLNYRQLLQEPPGNYPLCYCSGTGQSCADMKGPNYDIYLESHFGTVAVSGPTGGEFNTCHLGQYCYVNLNNAGNLLEAGDRMSFMPDCGYSDFIPGLPENYMTVVTPDNRSYSFQNRVDGHGILQIEPGMYRMCWCRKSLDQGMDCESSSDFNVVAGLFLVVGTYSGQVQTCVRGQSCSIGGIRGVGLKVTDTVRPMASCFPFVASVTWGWPPPNLPLEADNVNGGYMIEIGDLALDGSPESIHMCWCQVSNDVDCSQDWHFMTVVAVTLYTACAPGWYDLRGSTAKCQPCPPGFYCPGGWPAAVQPCPAGSTSPANSTASSACVCREGFQYDTTLKVCTACPVNMFKGTVDNVECTGECPSGTASATGAIGIRECSCAGDYIDTDPQAESFVCTDLMDLLYNFSGSQLLASAEARIFSFQGVLQVDDASTEALLSEIRSGIRLFIGLTATSRASFQLEVAFNSAWYVSYIFNTSEAAFAQEVHTKFDPSVLEAWVYQKMKGTALSGVKASTPSPIAEGDLQCPTGLAFAAGARISGIQDCRCPHGTQPSVTGSTGLTSGCEKCPAGKYKSAVADSECTACPPGSLPLTTLSLGAISHAACTCSPGYVAVDPIVPSVCEVCGTGFFCLGGPHRQRCGDAETTTRETAASESECSCIPGFSYDNGICTACVAGKFKADISNTQCTACAAGGFSGPGQSQCDTCEAGQYSDVGMPACQPCPAGRYSELQGGATVASCLPCAPGKWSDATGLDQAAGCVACIKGSTTALDGADTETLCIIPDPVQMRNCTSGQICVAEAVTGRNFQDGHHLAITASDCALAKSPVSGIANSGISKLATSTGSQYTWGDLLEDFTPEGGFTQLCWCANLHDLTCEGLNSNFWLPAGELLIVGPIPNSFFTCVRGQDCFGLQPFAGYGLQKTDHVRIQRDTCGAPSALGISFANQQGTGSFELANTEGSLVNMTVSFGKTDATNTFHVEVTANQAGYLLCWCGTGSLTSCANPADYVVYAGRLSILGPSTNQEKGCAVGQACDIPGILGASVVPGDRLMILSDCGRGLPIPGFPGDGLLDSTDGTNFAFAGAGSKILLSVPGIFRMCFCRPITGVEQCDSSGGFKAGVGLMTASGPFTRPVTCQLGRSCIVSLSGVGLAAGDQIWVSRLGVACGSGEGIATLGFPNLQNPSPVEDGTSGFSVNLSTLPFDAFPGSYQLCWCPVSADCSSTALFRAPGGLFQVDCPAGSFATGPPSGLKCELCSRGYYCAGGTPTRATRTPCAAGHTTLVLGAVFIDACVCAKGYEGSGATGAGCSVCAIGSYKDFLGNGVCTACPEGQTTYAMGSISSTTCFEDVPQTDAGSGPLESAAVPAISFNFSIGQLPVVEDPEVLRQQLIEMFVNSLAASTGVDPSAIQIDFGNLFGTQRRLGRPHLGSSRRLFDLSNIVITINTRSAAEAESTAADLSVSTLNNEIAGAVQSNPTLKEAGVQLSMTSAPETTFVTVTCGRHRSVPPGFPVQSAADCQCSPGYGYNPAADFCEQCLQGEYKAEIANGVCTRCPALTSTVQMASQSFQDCKCQEGLFEDAPGSCATCPEGSYCLGDGLAVLCPANSTTTTQRRAVSDCVCKAGFSSVISFDSNGTQRATCEPCPRKSYKPNLGNEECPLKCPANADSELGAVSLADCFCEKGFHASIDGNSGQLEKCITCTFEGLECRGGFEKQTDDGNVTSTVVVHALPIAVPGYFQTGMQTAVACDVLMPDTSSACLGGAPCIPQRLGETLQGCHGTFGNGCGTGSAGVLCGHCPDGWARDNYPDLCQICPEDPGGVLALGIISDLLQKAAMNFVVGSMAATTAVKGGVKLHTSIIRIGTQWVAACSVLLQFNLESLKSFGWSEEEEELTQLQECANANATECDPNTEGMKMPWPPEATQAMQSLFSILNVVPRIATVEFATSCFAQTIAKQGIPQGLAEDALIKDLLKGVKLMGPAVYYLSNPVAAMLAVYLVCACVVYVLVPAAAKGGVRFNPKAKLKKVKLRAVEKLAMALEPLLPEYGLTPEDLKEADLESATLDNLEYGAEDPEEFITGELAFCRPLAIKMCLHLARKESYLANLSRQVRLDWDTIVAEPELLVSGMSAESLQEAATEELSPSLMESFVKRALVWQQRKLVKEYADEHDLDAIAVAAAVADGFDSAMTLNALHLEGHLDLFKQLCKAACTEVRRTKLRLETQASQTALASSSQTVDIETLDFGLFSSMPSPRQLFLECIPVFWVMLLAMWPTLLSNFLKLLWCVSILEDNDAGITITKQRLRPDPELVCWSADHFTVAMISFVGLGVWCVAVPVLLYLRIWALKDRQSPDNNRKYGYFIQGYEPQFWWWDIIVKRLDILTMNLVTYTSLAADEKAKILLFPILSGCQLGIFSFYKPFTEAQGGILDVLEMCLLMTRFTLFSMVAIILIFNPSTTVTIVLASVVVSLMALTCAFFGLHIVAQFLRGAAEDMAQEEMAKKPKKGKEGESKKPKENFAASMKKLAVNTALPLFLPSDEEKFLLQWSAHTSEIEVVSTAQIKGDDRRGALRSGCGRRFVSCCKGLRALVLRLGNSVERQNFAKGITEFSELFLDEFDQATLPSDAVLVLLLLAESSSYVPTQTPLAETTKQWHHHARMLIHGQQPGKLMSADNLVEVRQRLLKLGAEDAVKLVTKVQSDLVAHRKKMSEPEEPVTAPKTNLGSIARFALEEASPAALASLRRSRSKSHLGSIADSAFEEASTPASLASLRRSRSKSSLGPRSPRSRRNLDVDNNAASRPQMTDMAMQTIQTSFLQKTEVLQLQGDESNAPPNPPVQIQVHQAVEERPEEPAAPLADTKSTSQAEMIAASVDVPEEPQQIPTPANTRQAAPKAPVPAVRAVAKASRPAPGSQASSPPPRSQASSPPPRSQASSPLAPAVTPPAKAVPRSVPGTPVAMASGWMAPSPKKCSVAAAPRPKAPMSLAEAKAAAGPKNQAVAIESERTFETEDSEHSHTEELADI